MRKIIKWGTPKKANPKYEKISHPPGISMWECKKNKGNHLLVFMKSNRGFFGSRWNEFVCSACGKKIYEDLVE